MKLTGMDIQNAIAASCESGDYFHPVDWRVTEDGDYVDLALGLQLGFDGQIDLVKMAEILNRIVEG